MIDDDIRGFNKKAGTNTVKALGSLISLIERGFRIASAERCCLWGIYPVNSGLYMSDTITTDLRFIIGCFWGIISPRAHKDPRGIVIRLPAKEDYARTLLAFERDGKVVRFNFVAPVTSLYQQHGGQQVGNIIIRREGFTWN